MQRGDLYEATLDPVEGSEQGGRRPVLIVSRDSITRNSPVVIVIPASKLENHTKIYPSQLVMKAGHAGLIRDSVLMAEQVRTISKTRLTKYLGHISEAGMGVVAIKLKIAMDLP